MKEVIADWKIFWRHSEVGDYREIRMITSKKVKTTCVALTFLI